MSAKTGVSRARRPNETHKRDGFILDWFIKRSSLDVNIYLEKSNGAKGELVSELEYPKVFGIGFSDWESEAIGIAKDDLKKKDITKE